MSVWAERLKTRRAAFVEKARTKLERAGELIEQARLTPDDAELVQSINRIFHQLAGAAGIYEMQQICQLAMEAEAVIGPCARGVKPLMPADLSQLSEFVASLLLILDLPPD